MTIKDITQDPSTSKDVDTLVNAIHRILIIRYDIRTINMTLDIAPKEYPMAMTKIRDNLNLNLAKQTDAFKDSILNDEYISKIKSTEWHDSISVYMDTSYNKSFSELLFLVAMIYVDDDIVRYYRHSLCQFGSDQLSTVIVSVITKLLNIKDTSINTSVVLRHIADKLVSEIKLNLS